MAAIGGRSGGGIGWAGGCIIGIPPGIVGWPRRAPAIACPGGGFGCRSPRIVAMMSSYMACYS
jgi:hypothetical protein